MVLIFSSQLGFSAVTYMGKVLNCILKNLGDNITSDKLDIKLFLPGACSVKLIMVVIVVLP